VVDGTIDGDDRALSRLASLIQLSQRGFLGAALALLVVLLLAGHLMFGSRHDVGVLWEGPWYVLAAATALSMLVLPMSSVLEGAGQVATQQRAQLIGAVAGAIGGWCAILAGLGLYAAAVIVAIRAGVVALLLARPFRPFARLGRAKPTGPLVRWDELWPLQWRLTLTWLTGILIYQSMVPLTFQLVGPVAAGQMGLLNQIMQAVIAIGGAWLVPAQPRLGRLASERRFQEIRRLTRAIALRSTVTAILVGAAALLAVTAVTWVRPDLAVRFGSPVLLAILLFAAVDIQPAAAMVAAVRFQKKEPFVRLGLITSAVSIGAMAVGAIAFGLPGIVLAFSAVVALVVVPWMTSIYGSEMAYEEGRDGTEIVMRSGRNPAAAASGPQLPPGELG
jgi:hypothetical protein